VGNSTETHQAYIDAIKRIDTHLMGRALAGLTVYVDGRLVSDVIEVKRYANGQGFVLSLTDLDGKNKKWIDGQYKTYTLRGEVDIQ
jgi:hypothetical protein